MIRRDRGALYIWEWAMISALVAVVLTISLPAYKKAAGAAKAAACSSNLQRLNQMLSMYVQDFDGMYPPLPAHGDLALAMRPVQQSHDAWTERLAPYREARKSEKQDPLVCPASSDDVMTYAYNAALAGRVFPEYDPKGPPTNEAEIKIPTQTYAIWDTANRAGANAIVGYRYYSGARRDGKYRIGSLVLPSRAIREDWIKPRHNGATAVLFCDGHITRLADSGIRVEQAKNPFDPLTEVAAAGPETASSPPAKEPAEETVSPMPKP
jgi:prepilin-type processing-associated H-X9-DG protein